MPLPAGTDFPPTNLPYGVANRAGEPPRVVVAIGEHALDLAVLAHAGLLEKALGEAAGVFSRPDLNGFLERGPATWQAVRERLGGLLGEDGHDELAAAGVVEAALPAQADLTLHLPVAVSDYVDGYGCLEHATNMGRLLRGDDEPLQHNWRHLPVGYHGRTAALVVSGTPVRRPCGQLPPGAGGLPGFGPTGMLDFELEVGFVVGRGNRPGEPIGIDEAEAHLFGAMLVNDWSARDIQAWEYRPLGPYLGKSFATTVSPWVVPLAALAPYRVAPPRQHPPVQPYLRPSAPTGFGIDLAVTLQTAEMRAAGAPPATVTRTSFSGMYWTPAQQLAHATVNGAQVRAGDLFASGTVSGATRGSEGSLMELTWGGQRPLRLPDGTQRAFLADGDTVTLTGRCGEAGGIGFGAATGRVLPAPAPRPPQRWFR